MNKSIFLHQVKDQLDFCGATDDVKFDKYVIAGNLIITPYTVKSFFFGLINAAVIFDTAKGLAYHADFADCRPKFSLTEVKNTVWYYIDHDGVHKVSPDYIKQNIEKAC